MSATITPQGIVVESYETVLEKKRARFRDIHGQDIYIEPDSQDGQMLAVLSLAEYDTSVAMAAVYNAFSPHVFAGRSSIVCRETEWLETKKRFSINSTWDSGWGWRQHFESCLCQR